MRQRTGTVWGLTGALVLLGAANVFGQATVAQDSKPAASVNGEIITVGELEAAIQQIGPMAVPLPADKRKEQQQEVLDGLIKLKLLRQFLKRQPPLDPKALEQRMSHLAYRLQQQNRTLADFCREYHQTPAQVRDHMAADMQWRAYADAHISDREVETFYRDNKDLFDNVTVHFAEIVLHVPAQASAEERQRIKATLVRLHDDIVNKKIDFAEAAKQCSHGLTKEAGGDLGWWPHLKGSLCPFQASLMETAFALQPGQVSDVLEAEFGPYLLKVIERNPGTPSDYNKIKEHVRQLCGEERQQTFLQEQRRKAKIEINLAR